MNSTNFFLANAASLSIVALIIWASASLWRLYMAPSRRMMTEAEVIDQLSDSLRVSRWRAKQILDEEKELAIKKSIDELLAVGLIEVNPDASSEPESQRYRLTEAGKQCLAWYKKIEETTIKLKIEDIIANRTKKD